MKCTFIAAHVNYAVPAQSVFARFVKLPGLDAEKIDKIISFEAQQNVPFPIDQVVWDYQLVGGGMGEQIQVVIVAIKRDLLDEINNAVEETGLRTNIVDVASMALYNAFCYNYTDLNGLLAAGGYWRAHDQRSLHRARKNFFAQSSALAAARSRRDCAGIWRILCRGGNSKEPGRLCRFRRRRRT